MKFNQRLIVLLVIFFAFSLIMASAIYWRANDVIEAYDLPLVSILDVILWQLSIWLPWVIVILGLFQLPISLKLSIKEPLKLYSVIIIASSIAILLHFGWFVGMSDLLSPYIDNPDTRFGVFRYFFIFWLLMDIVISISCILYISFQQKIIDISNPESEPEQDKTKPQYLSIPVGSTKQLLAVEDINWIEADDYYAKLHTDKKTHLLRRSLQKLMDELPTSKFVRIHRSTIINLDFLAKLARKESKPIVILKDGTERTISPSGHIELKNILK